MQPNLLYYLWQYVVTFSVTSLHLQEMASPLVTAGFVLVKGEIPYIIGSTASCNFNKAQGGVPSDKVTEIFLNIN